ncbi:MAG: hypothetical protein K0Q52_194 [Microbacterium sp.]|jgi:hypothetical protein|nr:hypothetical protein [Microbacterium sp.]
MSVTPYTPRTPLQTEISRLGARAAFQIASAKREIRESKDETFTNTIEIDENGKEVWQ